MSTKTRVITALALVLSMILAAFPMIREVSAGGPVTSNMLDRLYANAGLTEAALAAGTIDLNDEPLSSTSIMAWAGNPAITMDQYPAIDKFQIDMNNQWWPTGPNDPTHTNPGPKNTFFDPSGVRDVAALHFRRAVAHLANKDEYVTSFMGGCAYVMQTEVPVPALEGFTDYSTLTNFTANAGDPWSPGMGGYIYIYDKAKAAQEFELGGFRDYDGDTYREWRDPGPDGVYGTGDDGPIEELPNMKFYELSRGPWMSIAPDLYNDMLSVGIPAASAPGSRGLDYIPAAEGAAYVSVLGLSNYNFFAGGSWALGVYPDFIYNLYHSSMGQYAYALNYPGFKNHEFDSSAERVKYPRSLSDVRFAAVQAQWVKAKYVPIIELFASKAVKAYRTGWHDVVNMAGYGIDNRYSFLLMHWFDGPGTSRTGPANTIVYGLSSTVPLDLNIISSGNGWVELPVPQTAWYKLFGAKVLSRIYDSLIGRNPYNLAEEVGWLATSWTITDSYPGWSQGTVVEFTVRTGAIFHDGSPVKPADVAYSILLVQAAGAGNAWNYPSVMDVDQVEIQGNVVRVFFGIHSALALHWSGFMPIINKDLWDDAIGVGTPAGYTGFIPDNTNGVYLPGRYADASQIRSYHPWESIACGNPTLNDLREDGSGPWSFTSYTPGTTVTLDSFSGYFATVFRGGQALPFENFVNLAFHGIGDVNYPGSYGEAHGWYAPPTASWSLDPSSTDGDWANPANAYTSDNSYASSATDGAQHVYGGYGFDTSIPAGATITKVEVGLEAYTTGNLGINTTISWDGGATYYPFPQPNLLLTSDSNAVVWDDFTSATSWTAAKLSNANFKVKVVAWQPQGAAAAMVHLDWLPVRVTCSSSVEVRIVKPDSTVVSLLNPILISQSTPWSYSGYSVDPSIFSQSGTYTIQLVTKLVTNQVAEVFWDDVGLRLESEAPVFPISNMNFTSDISSWTITQTGTGEPWWGWAALEGNPSPGSGVGSLALTTLPTLQGIANLELVASQSFDWSSGTPLNAYFSYAFTSTITWKSSSVDVRIVEPDNTIVSLLNSIPVSQITPWSYSGCSINPSIFSQSGTYTIQLVTKLITNTAGTGNYVQVNWDDVGLRLESEPPVFPISNMNFTSDISSWTITQTGSGTPTSGWDGTDGNPSPGSGVGSLKLRATSETASTADLEFVVSQSFDWISGTPLNAYFSYAFESTGNSHLPYISSPLTNTLIGWTSPANAYTTDNLYATANADKTTRQYRGYDTFYLAYYGTTIISVQVGIEAFSSVSGASISISVSWDGGTSWAPEQSVSLPTADPDTPTWKDFTLATSWNPSKLLAANFRVRVKANFGGTIGNIDLDWIPLRVAFQGEIAENPKIDLFDLVAIITSAPSTSSGRWGPGILEYNPDADINNDGMVNVIDLGTAAVNYGKKMG